MSERDEFIRRAKLVYEATKDLLNLDEIKNQCDLLLCDWVKERELSVESRGTYYSDAKLNKMFASVPLVQDKNAELVPKYDKDGNVKGHILKHCALIKCGLTREEWEIRNSTSRITHRIEDGGQEVDPDDYLKVAMQLIQSNNIHEISAGLIAVTGRRPHEILWRGDFSLIRGETYQLMFSGQGKKRGELPKFKIATLLPAKYVKDRLHSLRQHDNLTAIFREIETEFPDDREAQNR
ncbi:MAG: protelomerase family protein, partial [Sphaerospermopsis kisseleviana]